MRLKSGHYASGLISLWDTTKQHHECTLSQVGTCADKTLDIDRMSSSNKTVVRCHIVSYPHDPVFVTALPKNSLEKVSED